jgi:hypothetical protein
MYSSTAGLYPSLILAGLAFLASLIPLHRSARLSTFHAIGAGAASFAAIFSVLNLLVQLDALTRTLLVSDLASGRLALRVISITAAVAFLRLTVAGAKEADFSIAGDYYGIDVYNVEKQWQKETSPPEQLVGQATVLSLVLCTLWTLTLLNRISLLIAVLNWAFAFTADDFYMAASYRLERKVQPPAFDAVLIWIWRTLTVVLFGLVMFQQFTWWLAGLAIALVVFFLGLLNLGHIVHKLALFFNSWGIIPPEMEASFQPDTTFVTGRVVRLFREHQDGPGEVVIRGVIDDGGATGRFHVELTQPEYDEALRAHRGGLEVNASGVLDVRGTYKRLWPVRSFYVIRE